MPKIIKRYRFLILTSYDAYDTDRIINWSPVSTVYDTYESALTYIMSCNNFERYVIVRIQLPAICITSEIADAIGELVVLDADENGVPMSPKGEK